MAKEYLDQLSEIMKQATARRFKDVNLECKHFFSGKTQKTFAISPRGQLKKIMWCYPKLW